MNDGSPTLRFLIGIANDRTTYHVLDRHDRGRSIFGVTSFEYDEAMHTVNELNDAFSNGQPEWYIQGYITFLYLPLVYGAYPQHSLVMQYGDIGGFTLLPGENSYSILLAAYVGAYSANQHNVCHAIITMIKKAYKELEESHAE
jgi:hypothetical protein